MMTRMGKKMNVLRCRLQTANVGRDTFKGEGGTVKSTYTLYIIQVQVQVQEHWKQEMSGN